MARDVSWSREMLINVKMEHVKTSWEVTKPGFTIITFPIEPKELLVIEGEHKPVPARTLRSIGKRNGGSHLRRQCGAVERVMLETLIQSQGSVAPRSACSELFKISKHQSTLTTITWFAHHNNPPAQSSKFCTYYLANVALYVLEHPVETLLHQAWPSVMWRTGFPMNRTF